MNLLIIRAINYKNKNKNKKFNSALKAETSENKDEFKSHNKNKNKNKNETKLKKSNEMSTSISDNVKKKKFTYIDCDYCERWHSQSCFYKHSESADKKWQKSNKTKIDCFKEKNEFKKKENSVIQSQSLIRFFCSDSIEDSCYSEEEF